MKYIVVSVTYFSRLAAVAVCCIHVIILYQFSGVSVFINIVPQKIGHSSVPTLLTI